MPRAASLPRWPAESPEGLAAAAAALAAGRLVLVPTESSYCLAASIGRPEALAAVRRAKSREEQGKPLLLLCASLEQAERLGVFDDRARSLAAAWPAPLTLVVAPRDRALAEALGGAGLALRVPGCASARALASLAGAFTGTSANRAGQPPLLDAAEAEALEDAASGALAGVLDSGRLPGGPPSTLVDTRGAELVILRRGAFSLG